MNTQPGPDAAIEAMASIIHALAWIPRVYPWDVQALGPQIPLFFGPCLYCGQGYVPHMPCPCPTCGRTLSEVTEFPLWVRGRRTFMLWWRWRLFRYEVREAIPEAVRVLLTASARVAEMEQARR